MRVGVRGAASLLAASLVQPGAMAQSAEDLAAGKQTYRLHCVQCHGEDGDAVGYPDIVPVAGINRRYPPDVIGQLSGAFSGRTLSGEDRNQVAQYMGTLRGAKGFADPGWLITPHMLERKAARIREFRILDVRTSAEYAAGHVANAVSVSAEACAATAEATARRLGAVGVTPGTMVVIYDAKGGPAAACLWWRIRQAGHHWVAVLDGGWERWIAERRFTTTGIPAIQPTAYPPPAPRERTGSPSTARVLRLGVDGWNSEDTLGPGGFRPNDELIRLTARFGLQRGEACRLRGPQDEIAHLLLTLHLLGYEPSYDAASSLLSLGAGSAP